MDTNICSECSGPKPPGPWFKTYECGCKIVGSGTQNTPYEIRYCPPHQAAYVMFEICQELAADIDAVGLAEAEECWPDIAATADRARSLVHRVKERMP